MNLTDLTRRVRKHLAEAGTGAHNDTDIQEQVRRSARDLARTYHLFKSVATLNVEADGNVTAPDDMAGIVDIRAAHGWDLTLVTPMQFASFPGTWTDPAYYWGEEYDTGGKILIYGRALSPFVVTYYRYPPDPAADRDAWGGKYPEYHDLIALHAAHQLQGLTGVSAAKDMTWLQRFEQRKDEFRAYLATARLGNTRMQFTPTTRFPSRSYR